MRKNRLGKDRVFFSPQDLGQKRTTPNMTPKLPEPQIYEMADTSILSNEMADTSIRAGVSSDDSSSDEG